MMIRKTAKTAPATRSLTEREAAALTVRIRKAVDNVWALLLEAQEREAWKALRYATWEAYVKAEFAMSRRNSYRLLDLGRVVREIEDFVPHAAQITQRDAAAIKDDLPAVKAEIVARIDRGAEPAKAATDVIAEKRAAKDKAKVEHDRQREQSRAALPDAVKQHVTTRGVAKTKADGSNVETVDRVSELEERVRGLEADNASLKAENAKFADMWVQYQQGGFEAVIAGKDEEIRTLNARLIQESEDKAGWMKRAKGWQKRATDLGWSGDVVIPLDPRSSDDEVISLG
ncbi:hypothetical protein NKI32_19870 [Mesorhizobium sp. M0761]|uniref:hypothetical protein n=1 Tax=unclassified Mesorhizobium TaxID=325217 RepID=UPI0003D04C9B|nr:hypothetical protein [Mesorhizobium sp. L2C085B000]ESZ17553.1 hypothetical protein X735_01465 [Mesorhizobium sp. L2C085B000]